MELNRRNMFRIALLITFGIAVFWVFENFSAAKATFFWVLSLFTPFLIGACIAFILNVPMRAIERHLWPNAKPPIAQKLRRPAAMALTLLCFFGVLSILVFLIVPELIRTASSFSAQIPLFLTKIEELFDNINQKLPQITGQASSVNLNLEKTIESFFSMLGGSVSMLTTGLFRFVSLLFGGAAKAVFGIIFAFYLLAQKETLAGQFRRVLTAYNQEKLLDWLLQIGRLTKPKRSHRQALYARRVHC